MVQHFMMAGLAFTHMDTLRPVLENPGVTLTNSSHMRSYIPHVRAIEIAKLKEEIEGQFLSIVFDGTTRIGEIVAIVARWCDDSFVLRHRSLATPTLATHANGVTLGRLVLSKLTTTFEVPIIAREDENCPRVVGFIRDSASVNGVAVDMLKHNFGLAIDVLCISHTLDNVGRKFAFENVDTFMHAWLQLAQSGCAKFIWRQLSGQSMKTFSGTRWWSKSEVQNDIFQKFNHLQEFVRRLRAENSCPKSLAALEGLFSVKEHTFWLQLCFAALYDVSTPLIKATYELEGNRLEILLAYERIQRLRELGSLLRDTKNKVSQWLESANSADGALPFPAIPAEQLPSVARLVKHHAKDPEVGTPISKVFPGSGRFAGRVVAKVIAWNPSTQRNEQMYSVRYSDNDEEDLSLDECRAHFAEFADASYLEILDGLIPAFDYLDERLDGTCAAQFSCVGSLHIFR